MLSFWNIKEGALAAEIENLNHIVRLMEAFRAFDSDDGSINAQELGALMGSLGYNPSENDVRAMMQNGDTNRDGLMSISEFLLMNTKNMGLGHLANVLKRAFEALSFEGDDDLVTGEELHEVVGDLGISMSLDDCQEIVASMNGDGDGAISLEEFELIVNSLN